MCFIVPTVVPWYFWGETLWNSFYLSAVLRYTCVLNATWLVNSAAHMWGTKPYDKSINPANSLLVILSAAGEGFHNYHHVFPHDYSTSEFGIRLNITTMFIDCMAFLGLASNRKTISAETINRRKERTGDLNAKAFGWSRKQSAKRVQYSTHSLIEIVSSVRVGPFMLILCGYTHTSITWITWSIVLSACPGFQFHENYLSKLRFVMPFRMRNLSKGTNLSWDIL